MTEALRREKALSADELASILRLCAPEGLLVGGQALAFWVDRLAVPRPAELASHITTDADFIGNAQLARRLGRAMGWQTSVASLDDATPQLAKVTHTEADGSIKQVDFLSGVIGLTTKDVKRRAMTLDVTGIGSISVMHPVDVLDSRVQNLHLLSAKRTPAGFAQARLAISMVKALIRAAATPDERPGLKHLERVIAIAQDYAGLLAHVLYGIDVLEAIPLEAFPTSPELHAERWPQVVAGVAQQRAALAKLAGRVQEPSARRTGSKRKTRVRPPAIKLQSSRSRTKKAR
ncbi:MAG: hypothetical protein MUF07_11240 [Steroidobacteraceae bacterium]|jgi:hypothetical protein|nr:hypothetical protein [Steroidobacteraceae bacterium]